MKIPLKAFILISSHEPYPDTNNIQIGGVASSAQGERVGEENSIVFPLIGHYDRADLISEVAERIEDNKNIINHYYKKPNPAKFELGVKKGTLTQESAMRSLARGEKLSMLSYTEDQFIQLIYGLDLDGQPIKLYNFSNFYLNSQ